MNKEDTIFNSIDFGAELVIQEAKDCVTTEMRAYEHHKKMFELANKYFIEVVCREVHYIWADYIVPAQRYLYTKSDPDNDAIIAFNQLTDVLSTAFDNSVKILEIHSEGLREHGWTIRFVIDDFVFDLYVPNMNTPDVRYDFEGQLAIQYFMEEMFRSASTKSYDILKIGQAINTTIKNNSEHWSYSDYLKYEYDDEYEDEDNEG